jgi:uncharacterized protein (TIGR03546 family)
MIRTVAKILKVLNSETDSSQISLALCLAMFPGFTPFISIHNLVVLFLVLILRVNLSTFLLGWAAFSGLAYLLDPLFNRLGLALLTADSLRGFWTILYNSTFWRLTRFNNSILMGSFIFSLLLFYPLYRLANLAVNATGSICSSGCAGAVSCRPLRPASFTRRTKPYRDGGGKR